MFWYSLPAVVGGEVGERVDGEVERYKYKCRDINRIILRKIIVIIVIIIIIKWESDRLWSTYYP